MITPSIVKGPGQAPRVRRSSLLPVSTSSASYASRIPPSSTFAVTTSSPSRGVSNKTMTSASTTKTLKRRTSTSILQGSSTMPSAILKSKPELSPQSKKAVLVVQASSVSEFGAITQTKVDKMPIHSSPKAANNTTSIKITSSTSRMSLPMRSSLKPTTAANLPAANSDYAISNGSSASMLPRSRIGSSTPTRSTLARQPNLNRVTSSLSLASKSPRSEQQKANLFKKKNILTPPVANSSSVKLKAALWAQMNESCSSPSPSGKRNDEHQKRDAIPSRVRRMSLVQQTSRILRPDAVRSRRTSLIAVQAPKVAAKEMDTQESHTVGGKMSKATKKDDNGKVASQSDLIDTELLPDDKMLDQLNFEEALLDQSISTSPRMELRRSDEVGEEMILRLIIEQRDEALNRERLLCEELKIAKERLRVMDTEMRRTIELQRQIDEQKREKSDIASQTDTISNHDHVTSTNNDMVKQQQYTEESPFKILVLERARDEWRHAAQLASHYLASLQSQSDICSNYFNTQLNMFQLSIDKQKMFAIQD